jgi:hypothetical protein
MVKTRFEKIKDKITFIFNAIYIYFVTIPKSAKYVYYFDTMRRVCDIKDESEDLLDKIIEKDRISPIDELYKYFIKDIATDLHTDYTGENPLFGGMKYLKLLKLLKRYNRLAITISVMSRNHNEIQLPTNWFVQKSAIDLKYSVLGHAIDHIDSTVIKFLRNDKEFKIKSFFKFLEFFGYYYRNDRLWYLPVV